MSASPAPDFQNLWWHLAAHLPTPAEQQQLETLLLADSRAAAFGVTAANVGEVVQRRSQLFHEIHPALTQFCGDLGWQPSPDILWHLWIPLALQLADQRQALGHPLIQGILGGQGTGKTTLAAILTLLLNHLGYRVCALSLDDLYKTYVDRQQLQQTDPRLHWRGPPGTHDVDLGLSVLQQLHHASAEAVALPRFDKSAHGGAGDRTQPEWVTGVDVVLFEGWFVGVRPINPSAFDSAPPPILTAADRAFARDCNTRLQEYQPLWQQLDRLMVLSPVDYRLSQQWRRQAEQQMKAKGLSGMSDAEINQFVGYFWRSLHPELFIQPLLHDPGWVDLVIEINADHTPGAVYAPARLPSRRTD